MIETVSDCEKAAGSEKIISIEPEFTGRTVTVVYKLEDQVIIVPINEKADITVPVKGNIITNKNSLNIWFEGF